ncbi:HAMP domain-containing protein [Deinococcus sp.]|uniref:HAMP domain-containing protein n=1 Tax=Deinococcus sp. TaxID=47478 RepID=UPI0025E6FB9A|nr:HAMP domain-containing protein [Deinococcus sp.]
MKYTVVIEQAVPETVSGQLQQLLSDRFGLSAEQSQKLASRRGGRLMKPTNHERARVLLDIFREVGASVRLEPVLEDGAVASAPLPANRMPSSPGAATPGVTAPNFGAPSGDSDLRATEFGQVPRPREQVAALATPAASLGESARPAPVNDDYWAELAAPAPLPGELGSAGPNSAGPNNAGPNNAGSGNAGLSTATAESAAESFGGNASSGAGLFVPEADRPVSVPQKYASALPSAESAPADIWSDFTGALTITDTLSVPAAAAEETPDLMMQSAPELVVGRRQPLSRRLTIASVTPLIVYTGLTLATLAFVLTGAQRALISSSASTVAAAVGSVLNTSDQNTVQQQLGTLLNRDSVGFVQLEYPDGTTFFRSQTPGLDSILNERVSTWVKANPRSGVFVQNQTPADLFKVQLAQLTAIGASDSEQATVLKTAIQDPANQSIANRNYQVERIGVYEKEDRTRETVPATETSKNRLLYRIAVGVPVDGPQAQLRNTLLTLLATSLLAGLIAAALAARAARRIVEPIDRLVRAADAISLGDLSQPVRFEVNDEVGDLAQALERMRLSLDAAMSRLRKRRKV